MAIATPGYEGISNIRINELTRGIDLMPFRPYLVHNQTGIAYRLCDEGMAKSSAQFFGELRNSTPNNIRRLHSYHNQLVEYLTSAGTLAKNSGFDYVQVQDPDKIVLAFSKDLAPHQFADTLRDTRVADLWYLAIGTPKIESDEHLVKFFTMLRVGEEFFKEERKTLIQLL